MNVVKESTREAFSRLYDEYMPKVYRYVYYKVNDVQSAEDITSDVFDKALVNFSKYSRKKASFSTWIFAITRNVVVDYYREQGKVHTTSIYEAVDMPSGEPDPEEALESKEEKQLLHACISTLSQDEQELVRLKFAMEMTNRDIAKVLGLSESNVGVRLYRIVRKLQNNFEGS
jgi:RNA polymerase sigma factor (sigma-70 family)